MIRDENGQLAGYVYVDTATTDIGGYVEQAKRAIAEHLKLPAGYTLLWTGQYEFQVRARERLKILIPLVFFIIFMLLYMTFHSASEATIVMLSVVYAMTGRRHPAVAARLQLLGGGVGRATSRSTASPCRPASSWSCTCTRRSTSGCAQGGDDRRRTTSARPRSSGSVLRLRPKLMTVSVVMAALVPILWSTGVGLGHHEADRRADHRRDGDVHDSRAHHHPGDFLHDEASRVARWHAEIIRH